MLAVTERAVMKDDGAAPAPPEPSPRDPPLPLELATVSEGGSLPPRSRQPAATARQSAPDTLPPGEPHRP